jgi:hypothetical protein
VGSWMKDERIAEWFIVLMISEEQKAEGGKEPN